jgi:hypothetical protein
MKDIPNYIPPRFIMMLCYLTFRIDDRLNIIPCPKDWLTLIWQYLSNNQFHVDTV